MDPAQIKLLIDVLAQAIHTFSWIVGISVTIMLAGIGLATGLVYRALSRRTDLAQVSATAAQQGVSEVSKGISEMTKHCGEMRSACREQVFGQFVPRKGIKAMDDDVKLLVEQAINATQNQVIENRKQVTDMLKDLKATMTDFQDEIWNAFHGHRHAEDGAVVRHPNPFNRKRKL